METPPNTTPQPFRQPVSSAKTPECVFLVQTHWDFYGIFCLLCLIFRVFSIGGWRAPSRGRKASRSWTGPAASNRWFCPGFVVLIKRGKSWNESPETEKFAGFTSLACGNKKIDTGFWVFWKHSLHFWLVLVYPNINQHSDVVWLGCDKNSKKSKMLLILLRGNIYSGT